MPRADVMNHLNDLVTDAAAVAPLLTMMSNFSVLFDLRGHEVPQDDPTFDSLTDASGGRSADSFLRLTMMTAFTVG